MLLRDSSVYRQLITPQISARGAYFKLRRRRSGGGEISYLRKELNLPEGKRAKTRSEMISVFEYM